MAEFRRFSSYYFPYINKLQYKLKPSLMFDSNEFQKSSVNMNKGASALHMYSLIKRLIINEFSKIWTYTNKKFINKAINNHMRAKRRKMCSMLGSLRDTFKNSKIAKTAAALTVAVPTALAAFGGAATDAVAGDGKIAYHKFRSDRTAEFVEFAAAGASTGRYALLVRGSNDVILREIYKLAQKIEADTKYDVSFLHVDREGPITNIDLLVNGQVITEIRVGGNIEGMKEALNIGFTTGGKRLATAEEPTNPDLS